MLRTRKLPDGEWGPWRYSPKLPPPRIIPVRQTAGVIAYYLDKFVTAAPDHATMKRRARIARLEIKLLGFMPGTTGYEDIKRQIVEITL